MKYVFAYGSLLNPESLTKTLPGIEVARCVPVQCRGYRRQFNVAFPNDGSQSDKSYFDGKGRRPDFVLMANMVPAPESIQGICIPVTDAQVEALKARELRYDLVVVTDDVVDSLNRLVEPEVVTFIGRAEFTKPADVARGVISQEYWHTIQEGQSYWDAVHSGFGAQFEAETQPHTPVVHLVRIDH